MTESHELNHRPFIFAPGTKIQLKDFPTNYTAGLPDKKAGKEALLEDVSDLAAAQDLLWASKSWGLIIILQALDAAGKDGIIKHVMSGVNPQGVNVYSFKAPTEEERLHHFLWRPMQKLPPRGMIAIFNRSYYEEVLVVRVHPEFLEGQWLPPELHENHERLWQSRYDDINNFENTMSQQNIRILKFFLHISKKEQKKRFLKRLDEAEKNWKFSANDVRERQHWDKYQQAYEDMLGATNTAAAPWHIIPADKKWFARACVADIVATRVKALELSYPQLGEKQRAELADARVKLEQD
jgi:PPK2 family polyphosphate:nucleotide phosphotransferase